MAQSSAPGTYFLASGVGPVIENSRNAYRYNPSRTRLFDRPSGPVPVTNTQQSDVLFFYDKIAHPTHTLAESGGDIEEPEMDSDPGKRLARLAMLESKLRFAGVAMEHSTPTDSDPMPDQVIAKTGIVTITNPMVGVPVPGALYAMSVPRELDEDVDDRIRPVLRRCTDYLFSDVAETFSLIQSHAMYSRNIQLEGLDVRRGFCDTQIKALDTMNSGLIQMVLTGVHALIRQGFLMPWDPKWSTVNRTIDGNLAEGTGDNPLANTWVDRVIPDDGEDQIQRIRQTIRHFARVQLEHRAFPVQAEGYDVLAPEAVGDVPAAADPARALVNQISSLRKYLLEPMDGGDANAVRHRRVQAVIRHGLASYIVAGRKTANVQPAVGFVPENRRIAEQKFQVSVNDDMNNAHSEDGGLHDFVVMQKNGFHEFAGGMEQFYQAHRDRIVGVLNSSIYGKHSFTLGVS